MIYEIKCALSQTVAHHRLPPRAALQSWSSLTLPRCRSSPSAAGSEGTGPTVARFSAQKKEEKITLKKQTFYSTG